MKLNVLERIMVLNIIAEYREGNIATFRMITAIKSKLPLTEEEIKEFDFKTEEGNFKWNDKGKEFKEFEFTEGETKLIKEQLEKLNKVDKLTLNHFSLYYKFVEPELIPEQPIS